MNSHENPQVYVKSPAFPMALGAHDEVENRLHAATRGLAYRRSKCPTDVVTWQLGPRVIRVMVPFQRRLEVS